ncbi:hypothetical protein phiK7B1_001 [Pseudomonas phage phiK7B1]|nr:hypothetical protein phiK7B1_001 [Pseudomonas phage phiK7B1]
MFDICLKGNVKPQRVKKMRLCRAPCVASPQKAVDTARRTQLIRESKCNHQPLTLSRR